jgi:hypothetical protein
MLLIADAKGYRRETSNVQCKATKPVASLKSSQASTMHADESFIGSVADMIVVETARDHRQVGFWDYARFGIPVTILTLPQAWSCCLFCVEVKLANEGLHCAAMG